MKEDFNAGVFIPIKDFVFFRNERPDDKGNVAPVLTAIALDTIMTAFEQFPFYLKPHFSQERKLHRCKTYPVYLDREIEEVYNAVCDKLGLKRFETLNIVSSHRIKNGYGGSYEKIKEIVRRYEENQHKYKF